jgi:hypothetical protein
MNAVIDNDILSKGTCYGVLPALLGPYGGVNKGIGILGAARFVLPEKIRKRKLNRGTDAALKDFAEWISGLTELEPTGVEQQLAAEFESLAQRVGVNLDVGESQLCAIVVERGIGVLLTGDKRAIAAIENLLDSHDRLMAICGKLRCLEQAVLDVLEAANYAAIRVAICSERDVDKALTICFGCASPDIQHPQILVGLNSYIRALRGEAKRVLSG